MSRVEVYDTTLRDGAQREGVSYTVLDKLRIARKLDELGVAFIEGGWPGSNPKDAEFFARAKDLRWQHATLCAFGSTRRAEVDAEEDANVRALIAAGTAVCTVFGKSSLLHVRHVLRTTPDENLRMIEETVACLRRAGRRVIYDAEHFFDGWTLDAAYALETLRAACRGGAETLVLCETNGGALPWQVEEVVRAVGAAVDAPLGIHAHDDSGCAVANSLAAVRAGARQVQGTINGYGERCGNANLCAVVPGLELKLGYTCLPRGALTKLPDVSRFVAEIANLPPDEHMAYVGRSAFAHKGGVHVAALRRHPQSYQHIDPALVGNHPRVVVSELGGRGNLRSRAEALELPLDEEAQVTLLGHIKDREAHGCAFEAAEGSVELLLRRQQASYHAPFRLLDYRVIAAGPGAHAEATVKITVAERVYHTAAEGAGPVHALDAALRKALLPVYPSVSRIHLADYKVRILDGARGTEATTRVLIDSTDGTRRWSTVGASSSILDASASALADSFEYALERAEHSYKEAQS
jgi:2-isopropylmalate synthase